MKEGCIVGGGGVGEGCGGVGGVWGCGRGVGVWEGCGPTRIARRCCPCRINAGGNRTGLPHPTRPGVFPQLYIDVFILAGTWWVNSE